MGGRIKKILKKKRQQIVYAMTGITLIIVIISTVYTVRRTYIEINEGGAVPAMADVPASPKPPEEIVMSAALEAQDNNSEEIKEKVKEEEIFTFLQGPKSWEERRDWSGAWGRAFYDGGSFGGFGCGLCCLANVYSTESRYQCTPVDMYKFAKRNTGYDGGGAIAWDYMDTILDKLGFDCSLRIKPQDYQDFKEQVSAASCSIVLISSNDSSCYWQDTPGHYVTIFLYDKETDTVFLADSGNPDHNRQKVELRKIYKLLKKASEWQYLTIGDYDSTKDTWKHRKSDGNWVKPEYVN